MISLCPDLTILNFPHQKNVSMRKTMHDTVDNGWAAKAVNVPQFLFVCSIALHPEGGIVALWQGWIQTSPTAVYGKCLLSTRKTAADCLCSVAVRDSESTSSVWVSFQFKSTQKCPPAINFINIQNRIPTLSLYF